MQVQVPEKDKKLIQRYGHGTAAVIVNSDCVEVILFGGKKKVVGSLMANTVILRFGKHTSHVLLLRSNGERASLVKIDYRLF